MIMYMFVPSISEKKEKVTIILHCFPHKSTYYVEAGIDTVPTVDKSFSSNFEIMNA